MSQFALIAERVKAGSLSITEEAPAMIRFISGLQDAGELRECKSQSAAVVAYLAHKQNVSVEEYNAALKVKARVEHRLGEVLARTVKPRAGAGRPPKISDAASLIIDGSLPEEITRKQSSRAQAIAAVPWEEIEGRIDRKSEAGRKASVAGVVKECRRERHQEENRNLEESPATIAKSLEKLIEAGKHYYTILADPPWRYDNQGTRAAADNHYGTLAVSEIAALPVERLAAPQCHLWLWTTNGFLRESFGLFDAWGFEFKSSYIWCKPQMGIGNYLRNAHEFLLLATRGGLTGAAKDILSWGVYPRGRHSAKPGPVRSKVIEAISPGPRLELFGREPVAGWDVWGNEVATAEANLFRREVVV